MHIQWSPISYHMSLYRVHVIPPPPPKTSVLISKLKGLEKELVVRWQAYAIPTFANHTQGTLGTVIMSDDTSGEGCYCILRKVNANSNKLIISANWTPQFLLVPVSTIDYDNLFWTSCISTFRFAKFWVASYQCRLPHDCTGMMGNQGKNCSEWVSKIRFFEN